MDIHKFPQDKKLKVTDVDILISRGFSVMEKIKKDPGCLFTAADNACLNLVKELQETGDLALKHKENIKEYTSLRKNIQDAHSESKEIM